MRSISSGHENIKGVSLVLTQEIFYRLHTVWLEQSKSHAGIIIGQQFYSIGEQMRRLLRLLGAKSAEKIQNQVEFLSNFGEE